MLSPRYETAPRPCRVCHLLSCLALTFQPTDYNVTFTASVINNSSWLQGIDQKEEKLSPPTTIDFLPKSTNTPDSSQDYTIGKSLLNLLFGTFEYWLKKWWRYCKNNCWSSVIHNILYSVQKRRCHVYHKLPSKQLFIEIRKKTLWIFHQIMP